MLQRYLLIENCGQFPSELFTVLGHSMADTYVDSPNSDLILGQFGSGGKHAVALLLRNDLIPIVFTSTLKMEFFTSQKTLKDGLSEKSFDRICVKYSGKENGKTKNNTEELSMTTDFGKINWVDTSLALRELVSNAIDFSIRKFGNWDSVNIELVDESKVRAKSGYTRIFVPVDEDVIKFYLNLGKWFLHFSEPENIRKQVLPKKDRNFTNTQNAVIYRRGVFMREFNPGDVPTPSLFDYNLIDIPMGENRQSSDWDCKYYSNYAFCQTTDLEVQKTFFANVDKEFWENKFESYSSYQMQQNSKTWIKAFTEASAGEIICTAKYAEKMERKGYLVKVVSEQLFNLLRHTGVKTYLDILSINEKDGIELVEPTEEMKEMYNDIWGFLESVGLTQGKEKPPLFSYVGIMDGESQTWGFFRDNEIYLKSECSQDRLRHVLYEEISHAVTLAGDASRDFQNFLLDIIVAMSNRSKVDQPDAIASNEELLAYAAANPIPSEYYEEDSQPW